MIFQERKIEKGYSYDVEDVFGEIHIDSTTKLDPDTLDGIVMLLLKQNISAEVVDGEVKHKAGVVKYTFKRRPLWEDNDDEPCDDTPTSTNETESASTPTSRFKIPTLSWLRRFVEAFREAWRKAKK